MSVSIYHSAERDHPLTAEESAAIDELLIKYAVDEQAEHYVQTGEGFNWESFWIYDPNDPSEPAVIFEGATKLPDNSDEAIATGMQHWCNLLSEIRRLLWTASWTAHIDDADVRWDEESQLYVPFA